MKPKPLLAVPPRQLAGACLLLAISLTLGACQKTPKTSPVTQAEASPTALGVSTAEAQLDAPRAVLKSPQRAKLKTKDAGASAAQPSEPLTRRPKTDAPRIYAKTRNVWIRSRPTSKTQWIGFLWFGDSVRLRSPDRIAGYGCRQGWYAVEPHGYVCVDGERATLDPNDEVLQGLFPYSPNPAVATPHPHYGESTDAQRYVRLPTENHQSRREWDYRIRKKYIAEARSGGPIHKSLLGLDLTPATMELLLPTLPRTLQMDHRRLKAGSTVAWTHETEHDGRTWLLTEDLTWVPKDRVKPFSPVNFEGLHLSERLQMPVASFRASEQPRYRKTADDAFSETGTHHARLSWVSLTGKVLKSADHVFHETIDGDWIREDQAVIPRLQDKTPWGSPVLGKDDPKKGTGKKSWIDVSILEGWLVAYVGTRPVFVTLMSPGRGGAPHGKRPPLETASTPTGRFKITGKFVTSAMISPSKMVHSAVPFAQNFSGPHAIHGAYWHNSWGERKSGGCINLSPKDAKWLFDFTEPRLPDGWHGVRWLPKKEAATTLIVRR